MRLWRQVVTSALLAPVLLELVLQAGAVVVWLVHRPGAAGAGAAGPVVLCVGDSFTHGMGASAPAGAYPAQLERTLADRGETRTVVNGGYPGRSSREVLELLDGQLRTHRPLHLCVLVGINDSWQQPQLLDLPPPEDDAARVRVAEDGFRLELRTLRLLRWLLGRSAVQPVFAPAPSAGVDAGATGVEAIRAEVRRCLGAAGDPARAVALLEGLPAPERLPYDGYCLVDGLQRLGRRDAARAETAALERGYRHHPTREAAEAWLSAVRLCGESARALRLAEELLGAHPESEQVEFDLGVLRYELADQAFGVATIERAIARHARPPRHWLRLAARMVEARDPARALRYCVRAFAGEADRQATVQAMLMLSEGTCALPRLEAAMAELGVDPASREQLRACRAAAFAPDWRRLTEVYAAHLRQIVARARHHGAEPLLLGYPTPLPGFDEARRSVAFELGVRCIEPAERFGQPRAEPLLVPDGHCNDAGYRLLAEMVADGLIAR